MPGDCPGGGGWAVLEFTGTLEDLPDGNRSHGKLQKRTNRSKSTRVSKGARRYTV